MGIYFFFLMIPKSLFNNNDEVADRTIYPRVILTMGENTGSVRIWVEKDNQNKVHQYLFWELTDFLAYREKMNATNMF